MEDVYRLVVAMLSLTAPNDEASRQTIATLRGRARSGTSARPGRWPSSPTGPGARRMHPRSSG